MPPKGKKRKTIARYGSHGDSVRVYRDKTSGNTVVRYVDATGAAHRKYFELNAEGEVEARVWAESYFNARHKTPEKEKPRLTLSELWKRFAAIEFEKPEGEGLRAKTIIGYKQRWAKWQEFMGADAIVDDTTLEHVASFVVAARKSGIVLNQVHEVIKVARIVYNWGTAYDLINTNKLAVYRWRQPKDVEKIEPAEYSSEEFEALLRQFDPRRHDQWRAWVALMLFGHHGQRANATLHLRWSDIDFEAGVIRWPKRYQKQGKLLVHPITFPTLAALITAKQWREHNELGRSRPDKGVTSHPAQLAKADWVLFATRDKARPYSYTAFHYQLKRAEEKAEVPHLDYRAGHGFRRMAFGNIREATGDAMLAMEYIGDTDLKVMPAYDKRKQQRINQASEIIGGPK